VGSLILASMVFKLYVSRFGNYSKTYGSLGAVIVLMLWLNVAGLVILLGAEVNALLERYAGKGQGAKPVTRQAA
jgi:membrane protein